MTSGHLIGIIALPLLLVSSGLSAQTQHLSGTKHRFEIGAGADIYGILGAVGGPARNPGLKVFFEYRYMPAKGWDVGANIAYQYGTGSTMYPEECRLEFHQPNIMAVSDYTFRYGKDFSPFLGAGLGAGFQTTEVSGSQTAYNEVYGTVCPRIGVEILRHFRIIIELKYAWNTEYGFLSTQSSKGICFSWTF